MTANILGRVWKFGDHISTDHILPSRFMTQVKPHELAKNCLTPLIPDFAARVQEGDVLVAGDNVGYGSSREQAPWALKYAGIRAVIAKSFARIFYRNCYNIGIPALICPPFVVEAEEGDEVEVRLAQGKLVNVTKDKIYDFEKPPSFMLDYIKLGGLIPYIEAQMNSDPDKKMKG
jgi:3-isopropylmalate/(R)-2-methylmalate dehydratase small subunit